MMPKNTYCELVFLHKDNCIIRKCLDKILY